MFDFDKEVPCMNASLIRLLDQHKLFNRKLNEAGLSNQSTEVQHTNPPEIKSVQAQAQNIVNQCSLAAKYFNSMTLI